MPPKKGKKSVDLPLVEPRGLDTDENEFFLLQMKNLEEQLQRYQLKCEELEVQKMDFTFRYNSLEIDMADVIEYLERTLSQKKDVVNGVSESLVCLQQDKDDERAALELQLSQLSQESQGKIDKLTSENVVLCEELGAEKLAVLEVFQEQKERLMAELASLEEQLINQKKVHSATIYDVEKRAVLERDRLKKDMHTHVAAVAEELLKASERNMSETTVKVTQENAEMRVQLSQRVLWSRILTKENESLRSRKTQLQLDVDALEPLASGIGCNNQSNQKVVLQLTEKCRQLQSELVSHSSTLQGHQQLQTQHTLLQDEMDALRWDHCEVTQECRRRAAKEERLEAEVNEERKRRSQLERILEEAAFALQQELEEGPENKELDTPVRGNMMQKLLALLDGASQLGSGPAAADLVCNPNRRRPTRSRRDGSKVTEEYRRRAAEEECLEAELREERKRRSQLDRFRQEAVTALQQELEQGPEDTWEEDRSVHRNLMQQLVVLLDGGSHLGSGLAGTDLVCDLIRPRPAPGRATIQRPVRSSNVHPAPLSSAPQPHFQTGVLGRSMGLVPQQNPNVAALLSTRHPSHLAGSQKTDGSPKVSGVAAQPDPDPDPDPK